MGMGYGYGLWESYLLEYPSHPTLKMLAKFLSRICASVTLEALSEPRPHNHEALDFRPLSRRHDS